MVKIIFILIFTVSLNAGMLWDATKAVGKGATIYGAKKTYQLLKKNKTKKVLKPTRHSVNQKINRNVTTQSEIDALKRPLEIKPVKKDSLDRPSQRYVGEKAEVAINPLLGKIVSVNPTSKKKAQRLLRKKDEENK